jgi:hypothetical protein
MRVVAGVPAVSIVKSRRGDMTVAQGKRSAALGCGFRLPFPGVDVVRVIARARGGLFGGLAEGDDGDRHD